MSDRNSTQMHLGHYPQLALDTAAHLARDDGRTRGYYLERAYLLALLATFVPAVISYSDATRWPSLAVLCLRTPAGRLYWHLNPRDLWLFPHVPLVPADDPRAIWDHSHKRDHFRRIRLLVGITRAVGRARHPVSRSGPRFRLAHGSRTRGLRRDAAVDAE